MSGSVKKFHQRCAGPVEVLQGEEEKGRNQGAGLVPVSSSNPVESRPPLSLRPVVTSRTPLRKQGGGKKR